MNSYLLELLATDRAESWGREAQSTRRWKNSRSPAPTPVRRSRSSRFSINRAREATPLVDCR
jgi:hypothetical protein